MCAHSKIFHNFNVRVMNPVSSFQDHKHLTGYVMSPFHDLKCQCTTSCHVTQSAVSISDLKFLFKILSPFKTMNFSTTNVVSILDYSMSDQENCISHLIVNVKVVNFVSPFHNL